MGDPLKVLMAAIRYPPAPGGAEDHVHELSTQLVGRGHQVVVYTSDLMRERPFEHLDGPYDKVDGVRVVRHRAYRLGEAIHYPVMPGQTGILREPADLVHAHSFGYMHMNLVAVRRSISGTPLVITPHYHPPETMQGGWLRHQLRRFYDSRLADWVIAQADALLFNSRAEMRSMAQHIDDPGKARVIPNGLHTEGYENLPDPGPFRERRGIGGPMLLYLGRMAENKRMELVIGSMPELLEDFPDLKLVIAGPDDGAGKGWERLAGSLGLGNSVGFEGFLSEEEKRAAFTAADVFVLPSEWEAYGLVLMEAQACGTPCLVSDRGGPQEVIEPGVSGQVVASGDQAAWRDAIAGILADDAMRRRLGRGARERAMTVFSWPSILDRVEEVYEEVVGEGP